MALFDILETSDNTSRIESFLSLVNIVLSKRPDVLVCWPMTEEVWDKLSRAVPREIRFWRDTRHAVSGPPAREWPGVLDRVLSRYGRTLGDVGVARDLIETVCAQEKTIGDFLGRAAGMVADRVAGVRERKRIPALTFVVSSGGDVVMEANRLRRAGDQTLVAEPLLGGAVGSEAGEWWAERNKDPAHHLGYIGSLFDARLLTLTAGAVVHAVLRSEDEELREAALREGARTDETEARRAVEGSEVFRFLKGERIPQRTSGASAGVEGAIRKAYAAILRLSAGRRKAINRAVCALIRDHLPAFYFTDEDLEVCPGGAVTTGAVIRYNAWPFPMEFLHLGEEECDAASISAYLLDRLGVYARLHDLIPR